MCSVEQQCWSCSVELLRGMDYEERRNKLDHVIIIIIIIINTLCWKSMRKYCYQFYKITLTLVLLKNPFFA
jgi:hypothetical protein